MKGQFRFKAARQYGFSSKDEYLNLKIGEELTVEELAPTSWSNDFWKLTSIFKTDTGDYLRTIYVKNRDFDYMRKHGFIVPIEED